MGTSAGVLDRQHRSGPSVGLDLKPCHRSGVYDLLARRVALTLSLADLEAEIARAVAAIQALDEKIRQVGV